MKPALITATRFFARYSGQQLLLGVLLLPRLLLAQPAPRPVPSRLAPTLQAASAANAARPLRVRVADGPAFRQWARQQMPAARLTQPGAEARTLTVTGFTPAQLAACPLVEFIDVAERPGHEERRLSNSNLSVNAISAVHARFPDLTGQGLTASVKEDPFDPTDIDLRGRVVAPGTFAAPYSDHATAMATLLGGAGNSDPLGRGVAPAVRLATASFASFFPDDGTQLTQAGVSVQNHSYGAGSIENYYGLEAQAYDQHTRQFAQLLHVFSSGNVGTAASPSGAYRGIARFANITGQFKMSKNALTVGNTDPSGQVAALSSRGPAYDGRLKPELVAYGEGGSSDAAALVSGLGILLQQQYRDQHAGTLPPAALVKAVLLNSADDLGRPELDYESGFGQADALGAVGTMRTGRFFGGSATPGTDQVFSITVPAGQQQLKATLVWSDPAAVANAATALVNDLDLELVALSTGQRWLPWALSAYPNADSLARPARRRADHLNNAEQVTLALPAAGTYELHVRGYAVPQGPQTFSLAYETSPPGLTWTHPVRPDNLRPASTATLRWQWSGPATATARLDYRPVGRAPGACWPRPWCWQPTAPPGRCPIRPRSPSSGWCWAAPRSRATRLPLCAPRPCGSATPAPRRPCCNGRASRAWPATRCTSWARRAWSLWPKRPIRRWCSAVPSCPRCFSRWLPSWVGAWARPAPPSTTPPRARRATSARSCPGSWSMKPSAWKWCWAACTT